MLYLYKVIGKRRIIKVGKLLTSSALKFQESSHWRILSLIKLFLTISDKQILEERRGSFNVIDSLHAG